MTYYYGGEIYKSGNEGITIEEFRYTFSRGIKTYMQTTIETDIHILPKSAYTLYDVLCLLYMMIDILLITPMLKLQ